MRRRFEHSRGDGFGIVVPNGWRPMDLVEQFISKAKGRGQTVVLPEGADSRVVAAARRLVDEQIAVPIVLGHARGNRRGGRKGGSCRRRRAKGESSGVGFFRFVHERLRCSAKTQREGRQADGRAACFLRRHDGDAGRRRHDGRRREHRDGECDPGGRTDRLATRPALRRRRVSSS